MIPLVSWRSRRIVCLWLLWVCALGHAATVNQLLEQSQAELNWHTLQQRGELRLGEHYISFGVGIPFILLSNGYSVAARVVYADGVLSFDEVSSQIILHYLQRGSILPDSQIRRSYRIASIIIDAGHGGRDSGAIGRHGSLELKEKDVTLAVSLSLAQKLRALYPDKQIVLTRKDDSFPSLEERVAMVNELVLKELEAAIFISIHANAAISNSARGFEVWHLPADIRRNIYQQEQGSSVVQELINEFMNLEYIAGGKRLAEFLRQSLNNEVGRRSPDRGLREEAWFVVRGAHTVAVLVELGFVTHAQEARLLASDQYQEDLARALSLGIREYVDYFEHR